MDIKDVTKEKLPDFYYEIDDDKTYNADEVKELCKNSRNEGIQNCIKTLQNHFNGEHMVNFRARMTYILGKNLI